MIVLNFHRVEAPTGFEINRVSPDRFERLLGVVGETGRVVGALHRGPLTIMPEVLFTFDDGFGSIVEHALPRLRSRRWGALVFLVSKYVGQNDDWDVHLLGRTRPMMTWRQAREWASAGFIFGSHTRTHRDLTALSDSALKEELVDSKREIEDQLGAAVSMLSYPFGRHDRRVRDAARAAGYEAAFAVNGPAGDRYAIPRVNVHALLTTGELRRILTRESAPSWRTRLFTSLSAGSATVRNWRMDPADFGDSAERMRRAVPAQMNPTGNR